MTAKKPTKRRGRHPLPDDERKDRLVQTRVPEVLDETLREAARKNRVSVSQLIRNVLENTFDLVDNVVTHTSGMTAELKRDARRVADSVRGAASKPKPKPNPKHREQIYAWQDVVLNRDAACSRCKRELGKGERGSIGLQDDTTADKVWLCSACAALL